MLIPTERLRSARGFLDGQLQCPGGPWLVRARVTVRRKPQPHTRDEDRRPEVDLLAEPRVGGASSFSLRGDRGTICGMKPLPRREGTRRPCECDDLCVRGQEAAAWGSEPAERPAKFTSRH